MLEDWKKLLKLLNISVLSIIVLKYYLVKMASKINE